uniref:Uncharacterized protein n=1 Tax=Clastoptera arizonana TaxID=38151 RepID=A0A1B6DKA7_9HEMI
MKKIKRIICCYTCKKQEVKEEIDMPVTLNEANNGDTNLDTNDDGMTETVKIGDIRAKLKVTVFMEETNIDEETREAVDEFIRMMEVKVVLNKFKEEETVKMDDLMKKIRLGVRLKGMKVGLMGIMGNRRAVEVLDKTWIVVSFERMDTDVVLKEIRIKDMIEKMMGVYRRRCSVGVQEEAEGEVEEEEKIINQAAKMAVVNSKKKKRNLYTIPLQYKRKGENKF